MVLPVLRLVCLLPLFVVLSLQWGYKIGVEPEYPPANITVQELVSAAFS